MKEITEQNYKHLEFNFDGIVIAYPKVDLYFNAEFYFIKQKIDYDTDKRTYTMSGYNQEDCTCNGISFDGVETRIENVFNCFSQMNYYQFENMEEFCEWYLHKDDKIKESIKEFMESTNKFYTKQTKREQLKDVLRLLELRDMKANTLEMLTDKMDNSKREYLLKQLERDEKRIEDFLNGEV